MRKLRLTELNSSAQDHQSQDSNTHLSEPHNLPLCDSKEQMPDLEINWQEVQCREGPKDWVTEPDSNDL